MREESRSATDALASAVERVRHPRSIIRVVAVNYFSPALSCYRRFRPGPSSPPLPLMKVGTIEGGPLVGGTLTVIVTVKQGRKVRSDVMREDSHSATDALASAVEGVRHPRSIICVVAVNYFSPALVLRGYHSLLHPCI
ncbi:hypothetical protein HN51_036328 [Arachis hypogaea]